MRKIGRGGECSYGKEKKYIGEKTKGGVCMKDEKRGRLPFALVAVIVLMLSAMSVTVFHGVQEKRMSESNVKKGIETINNVADAVDTDVKSQAYYFATETIDEAVKNFYPMGKMNKLLQEKFEKFLSEKLNGKVINGVHTEVLSSKIYLVLDEKKAMDVEPTESTWVTGEKRETTKVAYFDVVGEVDLRYYDKKHDVYMVKTITLKRGVPSAYPLIIDIFSRMQQSVKNENSEFARTVKYILQTIGQYRIANGEKDASKIITGKDVQIAVNLAILFMEIKYFRTFDKRAAADLELGNVIVYWMKKGTVDPADIYMIYSKETTLDLSKLITQYLRALEDFYISWVLDYIGITRGVEWFVEHLTGTDKVNAKWDNGSANVSWVSHTEKTWYDEFKSSVNKIVDGYIDTVIEKIMDIIDLNDVYNIPPDPTNNKTYFEELTEKVMKHVNKTLDEVPENFDEIKKEVRKIVSEEIEKVFKNMKDYLTVEENESWIPDWVTDGINWAINVILTALEKLVVTIIDAFVALLMECIEILLPAIIEGTKVAIYHALQSIMNVQKVGHSKILFEHMYNKPFVFYEEGDKSDMRSEEFWIEHRDLSPANMQKPHVIKPEVKISADGVHDTNVGHRIDKIKDAIVNMSFSELMDDMHPYKNVYKINIKAKYSAKVKALTKILIRNGRYYPTSVDFIKHGQNVTIDVNLTIPLYSGWELDGIDYKPSNTLAGDLWELALKAGKFILNGLFKIMEIINGLLTKLTDYLAEQAGTLIAKYGREYFLILMQILEKPASSVASQLWQKTLQVIWNEVGKQLNGMLKWQMDFFGITITVSMNVLKQTLTIMFNQTSWYVMLIFQMMIYDKVPWKIKDKNQWKFAFFVQGGISIGNYNFNVFIDPLRAKSKTLLRLWGGKVVNGKGWAFELVIPYEERYSIYEVSLETLGLGWLNDIHIPGTGLKVDINIGFQIKYYMAIKQWKKILRDAILDGFFKTVGIYVDKRAWKTSDPMAVVKAFIVDTLKNIYNVTIQRFNRLVPELRFFIDCSLDTEGDLAGVGFRLSFVIKDPIRTLAELIPWLVRNIGEYLRHLGNEMYEPNYVTFPYSIRERMFVRLDFYFEAGLPEKISNKIPGFIKANSAKKSSLLQMLVQGGRVKVNIMLEFNLPALVSILGWDWGKWEVGFGIYLPMYEKGNEKLPALSLKALSKKDKTGSKSTKFKGGNHCDFWLIKAKFYEVGQVYAPGTKVTDITDFSGESLGRAIPSSSDRDGDGLSDSEEIRRGTDPDNPDTDGDGLWDGVEVYKYRTDPKDKQLSGESKKKPWSGFWWPLADDKNPNLYDKGGPMDKYDQYVKKKYGYDPGAREWENRSIVIGGHKVAKSKLHEKTAERDYGYDINGDGDLDDPYDWNRDGDYNDTMNAGWFGHCHAWAAASVLEDEPTKPVTRMGITFTVGDQKGLLTECHYSDPVDLFKGTRYDGESDDKNDIYPKDFHTTIIKWIGNDGKALVFDKDPGEQVWNHPAYAYRMEMEWDSEDKSKMWVRCEVTLLSDGVDPNYVGQANIYETYYYWLKFEDGDIVDSGWGNKNGWYEDRHPDFIWHPIRPKADYGCPVKYNIVKEIISGTDSGGENTESRNFWDNLFGWFSGS